ncbi:MAG TPA: hypothetical protein VM943_08350 [Pyrinomonadaceae bacterium]|nr:hypothetical protein [Pyrinomonadaceae bacterium]
MPTSISANAKPTKAKVMGFRFNNIILFSIKVNGGNRIKLVTVARSKDAPCGALAGETPALPAFSLPYVQALPAHLFVQFSMRKPGGSLPVSNTPPSISIHDLLFTIHQLLFP